MLPIGRQIATVFRAHSDATAEAARQHAVAMLRMVGINDPERRAAAYPHEISGGMAQRVLIAMALSSKPKLLVADEPTSGLDVTIQAQFLDQLWHATRAVGSAVLLVTQDLGIIANYCDHVLVMQAGAVVEEAPAARFFAGPAHDYSRSIPLLLREDPDRDRPAGDGGAAGRASRRRAAAGSPRGLSKRFPLRDRNGFVHAVSDVTLRIDAGSTLGLVGESGSGKTTVGRCLLGLEIADAGELLYRGAKLGLLDAGVPRARRLDLRAKLQLVFQDPYDTLDPRWTVRDLLGEPLRLHARAARCGAGAAHRRALTDLVGLDRGGARHPPARPQRRAAAARWHRPRAGPGAGA